MKKTDYAYMVKMNEKDSLIIMYSFGAYYVARTTDTGHGGFTYTLRRYKTIGGAERYLLKLKGEDSEVVYGTIEEIKRGDYWKARK